jgi:hypothetical protein
VKRDQPFVCWVLPTIAGISLLLVACGRPQPAAPTPETSTVRLRAAIVAVPATVSCHGGAFCREDVLRPSEPVSEVAEDCTHRGGTLERGSCSRNDVVASCGGSTERGTVTVFTYAQVDRKEQDSAVSTMSDLCEAMGGELTLTAP